ncbi:hypothetical protein ES703_00052 [subsurface metagenome]
MVNWHEVREIAGDIFLVCLGVFALWCFLNIYLKGGFMFAVEPNTTLLVLEILATVGFIIIGLDRFWDDLKRKKERENES